MRWQGFPTSTHIYFFFRIAETNSMGGVDRLVTDFFFFFFVLEAHFTTH